MAILIFMVLFYFISVQNKSLLQVTKQFIEQESQLNCIFDGSKDSTVIICDNAISLANKQFLKDFSGVIESSSIRRV